MTARDQAPQRWIRRQIRQYHHAMEGTWHKIWKFSRIHSKVSSIFIWLHSSESQQTALKDANRNLFYTELIDSESMESISNLFLRILRVPRTWKHLEPCNTFTNTSWETTSWKTAVKDSYRNQNGFWLFLIGLHPILAQWWAISSYPVNTVVEACVLKIYSIFGVC